MIYAYDSSRTYSLLENSIIEDEIISFVDQVFKSFVQFETWEKYQ